MPQLVRNFPYLFFFPHSVHKSSHCRIQKAFLSPIPGVYVVVVRPFTSEALHLTKSVTICLAETPWDHQNNPPPPHNEQICSTAQQLLIVLCRLHARDLWQFLLWHCRPPHGRCLLWWIVNMTTRHLCATIHWWLWKTATAAILL